ncbi:MAG: AarF/ABC1/UbiB kinase family protein, partial [bacterium]
MLYNLIRPWVVWRALVPFILSFLRDYRRYIFFGPPRVLSETQLHARAVRMRETIARLGPTFIKVAQVLGMREDLIPKLYTEQLRMLQDKVPPFPLKQVEAAIRSELGKSISE